ncbi:hypothetical protein D3C87_1950210 [compost metagenome]
MQGKPHQPLNGGGLGGLLQNKPLLQADFAAQDNGHHHAHRHKTKAAHLDQKHDDDFP